MNKKVIAILAILIFLDGIELKKVSHKKRFPPLGVVLTSVRKTVGYGAMITVSGVLISQLDRAIRKAQDAKEIKELKRERLKCSDNNFGCIEPPITFR